MHCAPTREGNTCIPYHVRTIGTNKEQIVAHIKAREMDGILLCSPENVYYTSGLSAVQGSGNPILFALKNQLPSIVYIVADGRTTLLCWIGATMGFTFELCSSQTTSEIVAVFGVWQQEKAGELHKRCTLHTDCACLLLFIIAFANKVFLV